MAVGAEFGRTRISLHDDGLALDALPSLASGALKKPALVLGHRHEVAVFEVHDAVGDAHEGHGVAGDVVFALTQAHHHGRALTGADDAPGMTLIDHGHGIGARDTRQGLFEGLEQIVLKVKVHEVREHFRVGLALHRDAGGHELVAQLGKVFDDAVVHKRHAPGNVRVRVGHHRAAVRGPAGVGDARAARHAFGAHLFGQILDARHAAGALDFALMHHGHTAAVVAAVFQALEALQENGNDVPAGHAGHNSAHAQSSGAFSTNV